MIDIIIPAYNAHETLDKCLASLVIQTVQDFRVTVVNDGGIGYSDIINRYKDLINISEISYNQNRGAGYARQYGLDNTHNEFVIFVDADDTLYGCFALKYLIQSITSDKNCVVCSGTFVEENTIENTIHNNDMVWLFGKIYRRSYIEKYNIRFCPMSRWNEDNGFNTCVKLCLNDSEYIKYIQDVVYCWQENPLSITRLDNYRYTYDKSFVGYIENMLWAISTSKEYQKEENIINEYSLHTFMNIYQYFLECCEKDRRFLKQAWSWIQIYFEKAILPNYKNYSYELISETYSDVMANAYNRGSMYKVVPCITLNNFLYMLENKLDFQYSDNDISDYYPSDSVWLVTK